MKCPKCGTECKFEPDGCYSGTETCPKCGWSKYFDVS